MTTPSTPNARRAAPASRFEEEIVFHAADTNAASDDAEPGGLVGGFEDVLLDEDPSEDSFFGPSPPASGNAAPSLLSDLQWPLRVQKGDAPTVLIHARPSDSIAVVKQHVLKALGHNNSHNHNHSDSPPVYVRLICKGRLLAPDTRPLEETLVQPHDVVQAVLSTSVPRFNSPQAVLQRGGATGRLTRRTLRGSGLDPTGRAVRRLPPEEEEADDDDDDDLRANDDDDDDEATFREMQHLLWNHLYQQQQRTATPNNSSAPPVAPPPPLLRERRGFDRLRYAGLRRAEIVALRSYFNRPLDRWLEQQNGQVAQDEPDLVRRRLLQEEAWMQAQGPLSEFRLNLSPNQLQVSQLLFANSNNTASATGPDAPTGTTPNPDNANGTTNVTNTPNPLGVAASGDTLMWRSGNAGAGFSTQVGTDRDFMCGFGLGFCVGFVMLIWVWMPTVPHKQKLGILVGITLQLAVHMLVGPVENGDGVANGANGGLRGSHRGSDGSLMQWNTDDDDAMWDDIYDQIPSFD